MIARQIGQMLNAKEPKIVNGPEILNKFVGQSEENIRKLFKDAEAEVHCPIGFACCFYKSYHMNYSITEIIMVHIMFSSMRFFLLPCK